MGNSSSDSTYKEEIIGSIRGYLIGFKSKRIVVGQYTEYKDFKLLCSNLARIPKNTRYEFAAYDFATGQLLLLDNEHVPRCVISSLGGSSPCASFQPERVLLSAFKAYLEEIAAGKLKEASALAVIEEKSAVTIASAPLQIGFPDVVKPNNEVNVVAPPPYK